MSRARSGRIGRPDWDLAAAVALVLAFDAVVAVPPLDGTAVRLLLGLPVLLLVPGYAVVAALYPSAAPRESPDVPRGGDAGRSAPPGTPLATVERLVLSVVATVAVVAGVGLVVNVGPWGIRPVPLAAGVTVVTLLGVVVAMVRRAGVTEPARPAGPWEAMPSTRALRPRASSTYALNVLLVLAVVAAAGAVGFAADDGQHREDFTEFALLSENADGDLVAQDHPTSYTRGEARPLYLRVDNHEGQAQEYTVIVRLQAFEEGVSTPVRSTELDRLSVQVDDGTSRTVRYDARPSMVGDRLRLTFLLYAGDPPESPDRASAYRALHLWITVSEDG